MPDIFIGEGLSDEESDEQDTTTCNICGSLDSVEPVNGDNAEAGFRPGAGSGAGLGVVLTNLGLSWAIFWPSWVPVGV